MTQGESLLSAGRWLASAGLLVDTAQVRGIAHGQAEQAEDTFWPRQSPQLSLVCDQSQRGTQGVARSGAVCPAGRMAGPCLSRCRETPQPLTEAAVGPKEPGGAAAGPGGRVTGAPVETPTEQLTAGPEAPRRAPCGARGQLPGSGGSQSPPRPSLLRTRRAARAVLTLLAAGAVVAWGAHAGPRGGVAGLVLTGALALLPTALPEGARWAGWGRRQGSVLARPGEGTLLHPGPPLAGRALGPSLEAHVT